MVLLSEAQVSANEPQIYLAFIVTFIGSHKNECDNDLDNVCLFICYFSSSKTTKYFPMSFSAFVYYC